MSATLCDRSSVHVAPRAKHQGFGLALLRRIVLWPARVAATRRTVRQLASMSDYELRDIGIGRYDIINAAAGPLDGDPMERLVEEMSERRKAPRGKMGPL
jgi:uncharacterized protein YjiS (DUF1127 family)